MLGRRWSCSGLTFGRRPPGLDEKLGLTFHGSDTSSYQRKRSRNGATLKRKGDVLQGTLALIVLKTLDVLGPLNGYGIARRIEQISGDLLAVNQGTLYPVLSKLEQEGAIASEWGPRRIIAGPNHCLR
jgi:Transcriptional regulator PadR-like family